MRERVGAYIHPTARFEIASKTAKIISQLPYGNVHKLRFPLEVVPNEDIVVVVGGDGSVRSMMETLIKRRDDSGVLLIANGGSQNGLYRSLRSENQSFSFRTPRIATDIPEFKPGLINENIFTHTAGIEPIIKPYSTLNENLRDSKLPRDTRAFFAAFFSGLRNMNTDTMNEPFIRLVMTGQNLGPLFILPRQSLYSDCLSLITVDNMPKREMIRKLFVLFGSVLLGKAPPESLANLEEAREFSLLTEQKIVGLGGDIFPLSRGDVFIRRSDKGIRTAALVL